MPSSEKSRRCQKIELALAIAQGLSVDAWAQRNGVPRKIASRWAREHKVRAIVESSRRSALDRAVGRLAKHATGAGDRIARLAKDGDCESVQLAALRAIFSNFMAVSEFAGLEMRMTQIEAQIRDSNGK